MATPDERRPSDPAGRHRVERDAALEGAPPAASTDRRRFLGGVAAIVAGWVRPHLPAARQPLHPTPRPDITAARVLTAEQLDHPEAAAVFDQVRRIPEIIDGIRCHCGCATRDGYYSLLSCFEGDGMAQICDVCRGQAQLAASMHRFRRPLDKIREAIDRKYQKS